MKTKTVQELVDIFSKLNPGLPVYLSCSYNFYQVGEIYENKKFILIDLGETDNTKNEVNYET